MKYKLQFYFSFNNNLSQDQKMESEVYNIRIKRMEMILSLLNEDEKESGETSDKIGDNSTHKMEEENNKVIKK